MSDTEGKKIILVTALPGGKRLASLRRVQGCREGRVFFEVGQDERADSVPASSCISVKGGKEVAEAGLGLAVRDVSVSELGVSEDGEGLSALEAFALPADRPLYVVRGPDRERRAALADKLYDELPEGTVVLDCGPDLSIRHIDAEQMRACGWVRAEEAKQNTPDEEPA